MATPAEWLARKEAAELALHSRMTGGQVEEITAPDGSRTKFAEMDTADILSYIGFCSGQIVSAGGGARGPVYVFPV